MSLLRTTDFLIEVSKGNVPNNKTISKFGANPIINIADGLATIWDGVGVYVPPTEARIHDITSTDATDSGTILSSGTATGGSLTTLEDSVATFISDGVAIGDIVLDDTAMSAARVTAVTSETILTFSNGVREPEVGSRVDAIEVGDSYRVVTDASTGVSFIYLLGIDANGVEITEFVVLNGTSNVATVKSFKRQSRARSFAMASTNTAGTITSTAQTDGTVSCQIINGNNQSLMAIYTVPVGKKAFILSWWGSLANKQSAASLIQLKAGTLDGLGYVLQVRGLSAAGSSTFYYDYKAPLLLVGGTDIWVEANTDTNGIEVGSGFDILLVDE